MAETFVMAALSSSMIAAGVRERLVEQKLAITKDGSSPRVRGT
jgi:hypothetical protein